MTKKRTIRLATGLSIWLSVMAMATNAGQVQKKDSIVKQGVMLSELTLDRPLGSDGSWVELYNPSKKPVSLNGVTIVCDGKALYSFPKGINLPDKGIILVRFSSVEAKVGKVARAFQRTNSLTIHTKCLLKSQKPDPKNRQAGCCALVVQVESKPEKVLDYVQWGRTELTGKKRRLRQRAAEQRRWPSDVEGVYIGLKKIIGPALVSADRMAVLSRVIFGPSPNRSWSSGPRCWLVLPEISGTPSRGNMVPPPILHSPWMGAGIATDQDLQISVRLMVSMPSLVHSHHKHHKSGKHGKEKNIPQNSPETKHLPFRVQIAKDPHFREVVFDGRFGSVGCIKEGQLKPGRYYARVRMDVRHVSTNWSDAVFFRYQ